AVEGATLTADPALSEAALSARRLRHLSQIGLALSAERDIRRLLAMILTASRELTGADGGTLYIVERDKQGDKKLFFRAAQNDSIIVDQSMTFAVGASSLAGYAALTGEVLRFDDVYHLPSDAPFQFNQRFDQEHGYRTKSVLVVPLRDHNGDTIGVLQLINRKRHREAILRDTATVEREVIGFDSERAELAMTLASQAAVALNNNLLLREIEELFESFVVASSSAIEDRDPSTSGHSQRVTQLTLGLASAINDTPEGPYNNVHFSPAQMRELRYAALLHDFGKIGVREAILTKNLKIEAAQFEGILSRIAVLRAQRQAHLAQQKVALFCDESLSRSERNARLKALEETARQQQLAFEQDTHWLEILNAPPVAPLPSQDWDDALAAMGRLRALEFCDAVGHFHPVLTAEEEAALSVRRGTLTPSEFAQIQDHAQMS
ncbi:GAF domain-containing protein, partial [bacterium]